MGKDLQYNLTVKAPWGTVKQNRDLVDLFQLTRKLMLAGLPFCIRACKTKGVMSDRHLELVLGFLDLHELEMAQDILKRTLYLKPDP